MSKLGTTPKRWLKQKCSRTACASRGLSICWLLSNYRQQISLQPGPNQALARFAGRWLPSEKLKRIDGRPRRRRWGFAGADAVKKVAHVVFAVVEEQHFRAEGYRAKLCHWRAGCLC
jgi:hypothetical protein